MISMCQGSGSASEVSTQFTQMIAMCSCVCMSACLFDVVIYFIFNTGNPMI